MKMEGAAGDGPSAFAAGSVRSEYQGGTPAIGAPAVGTSSDRAQERFYANTARQLLRDELERQLRGSGEEIVASFAIWLDAEGGVQRFEPQASGNTAQDERLRAALTETFRTLRLPTPPANLPQPMRFRLTVRPQG